MRSREENKTKKAKYFIGLLETLTSRRENKKKKGRKQKEDQTECLKDLRSGLTRGPSLVQAKPARWTGSGSDSRQQTSTKVQIKTRGGRDDSERLLTSLPCEI